MDLGDIVSAAWALYVRHWRPLLGMGAVSGLAGLALSTGVLPLVERLPAAPGTAVHERPLPLVLAPLLVLGGLLDRYNQLALIRYSLETWADGRASPGHCYTLAGHVFWPVLLAGLISAAVMAIGAVTVLGLPVAIYFFVCWFFVGQVWLAEGGEGVLQAMRRSRQVVRGMWLRSALILAGVALLGLLPAILVGRAAGDSTARSLVLSALAGALAAPFTAAAQTLLYIDLRLRKHESITIADGESAEPL